MKKGLIRNIAIYIAFFQLFSSSALASNKYVLVNDKNPDNPIYQNYDDETDVYSNISIYDERNATHHQYGANQLDFDNNHYYRLLQDPLIREELKNISKDLKFDSVEHAETFYKTYLSTICDSGCGYASITNYVFKMFEGKEEEFYDKFGFPMYKVMGPYVDFNYEIFMLKYFNFYAKKKKFFNKIVSIADKKYYEELLPKYEKKLEELENIKQEHKDSFKDEFKTSTHEEYNEWAKVNKQYDEYIKTCKGIISKIKRKIAGIKVNKLKYGIEIEKNFGCLREYLSKFGINVVHTLKKGTRNLQVNDIITDRNYTLTEAGFSGQAKYDYNGDGYHSLSVVKITDDGIIIVSSWGNMYIYNRSKSDGFTTKIKLMK